MAEIRAFDERRRPRLTNFGALSAGMIVRGSVPAHILYGSSAEPAPPPPAAPASEPAELVAMPLPARTPPIVPGTHRKAMTVRLDPVHHLRLRLVGSYLHRSAQDIMVQALNAYLAGLPDSVIGADEPSEDESA